ncbi:MAG: NYN domain-containing protein [Candidatus Pacebacteria bacterium]|nr:NYN domain-containing protein [Candidatus Paceibacterota bacterium]
MKNKHFGQRVAVLIDVQNLYHSAKNLYKSRVNFGEILKKAVENRNLIRAFAYVIKTKTGEEKSFFEALTKLGIETRVKDLQEFYGGQKKGDWDVGLVIDAIRISPTLDTIVLVSGDGDFIPLVEYLKNQGKRVELIAFAKTASHSLVEEADEFTDLAKYSKKFLLKK